MTTDWVAWHAGYGDPASRLARRLPVVQRHIRRFLDERRDGDVRVVSLCSGSGSDLLPVLASHPARVRARLVELDPTLAQHARDTARALGLDGVEVVTGDASTTDAVRGWAPADLVLACGIFGNISDADVERTVRALPQLCSPRGAVVWTRHRRAPDLTPAIRAWFADEGFVERAFDSGGAGSYGVGSHELARAPAPLQPGLRLFTFVR